MKLLTQIFGLILMRLVIGGALFADFIVLYFL